jgi:hypothetical protein
MTLVNKDNNNVEGTVNNFVIKRKGITLVSFLLGLISLLNYKIELSASSNIEISGCS